jgi:hypothetical protein
MRDIAEEQFAGIPIGCRDMKKVQKSNARLFQE